MTNANDKAGTRLRHSKICQERFIKVHKTQYEYRIREQPSRASSRAVPWLQVKGHWLREAGFEVDTPVKIRVMEGCSVLTIE